MPLKKLTVFFVLLLLVCGNAIAQQGTVKGIITDTFNNTNLEYSSILLVKKDSTIYKFTRSKNDGSFQFNNIAAGTYKIVITHKTYADYNDEITVGNDEVNIGKIKMLLTANLLADVTVVSKIAAMRMRGDTLEYKTDSFKVRAGASVEDLLKVLPGIQVDKDGNITAQGQKIEKVLVDGEEFFGNDPTMATKGLQADALDKIQVFDKKSDQAEFTGIDDGNGTKTLNLKLKEDRKKGYFGKLDLAGGTNDRFSNTGMFNAFKGKRKLSAYGLMSSTGQMGLNWEDREKFGGGEDLEYDETMGYFTGGSEWDEFDNDRYYGQGLPTSWAGAVHYSNKFDNDKQNINGSYRYNKLNTDAYSSSFTQSLLQGKYFYTRDTTDNFSTKQKHAASGVYDFQIDSSTSIKIKLNGNITNSRNNSLYNSVALEEDGSKTNDSRRFSNTDADLKKMNASILFRKKFKKAGRTVSLNIANTVTDNASEGYLNSTNNFYTAGTISSTQIIDQFKDNASETNSFTSKIIYTEPLSPRVFMEVNYGLRFNKDESKRLSYNKDVTGKYTELDATFSNNYEYNFTIYSGGLMFKYNGKKLTASAGSDVANTSFKQKDLLANTTISQNVNNLFPRAQLNYKITSTTRLAFSYNGNTRQPTITQIQPIQNNNDPLNIAVGNPDLKQQFTNNFRINFNKWKLIPESGFYLNGNFTQTSNAINRNETITADRKRTYQFVNTDGNFNYNSYIGHYRKIKWLEGYLNINAGMNGARNINFINGEKNTTTTFYPNVNIGLNKHKENKYSFYVSTGANYNFAKSTINIDEPTKYWTYNVNANAYIQLPWKLEISVDNNFQIREKINEFDTNNDVFLVNAFIGRKILKNDKASIRLQGNDILNQNKGFDRFNDANTFRQNNYNTITRYFSLNFIWNFSKTPGGASVAAE